MVTNPEPDGAVIRGDVVVPGDVVPGEVVPGDAATVVGEVTPPV
jgi:hypothetical protein